MRGLQHLHRGLPDEGHGGQLLTAPRKEERAPGQAPRPEDYLDRDYRRLHSELDLCRFQVRLKETDLDIGVSRGAFRAELALEATELVRQARADLDAYIASDPVFLTTLEPHAVPRTAPAIVRTMAEAGAACGVGPMAAVAGAIAEWVGRGLEHASPGQGRHPEIIVENGGDIYLRSARARTIGVFAGTSPFTGKVALEIGPEQAAGGLGVCTSSGTVGPSLSFGRADAAIILAGSAALADAVATATGNRVKEEGDLQGAVDYACAIPGVSGAVVILGSKLAVKGRITLKPLGDRS